ncbi:DNA primase [uncultured Salinisphaera sp.]|uniref:DNA primase n=1 Tax=uncultured Salinisphaera sp. TaxID=359372 RepID=UPI0032B18C05|tara:strand:+ start:2932 stop:4710 length:1779 start_codon:yes stop_codon:yes gene_type:complete
MARIPQSFIDQLLDRTDIVSIIDVRVSLKKSGREYSACCPFHDENTPSFTVSPTKQFYHCFGCGAHGSAISFLMEYDRLEFRDAVDVLAQAASMELPEEAVDDTPAGPPREPLYDVLKIADRHYQSALRASDTTIAYLKNRGVSGDMAKRYGLGFAADAWDTLTRTVGDKPAAARAGMLIERDSGGYFDRFRNRLMFPIRDTRGRTIAFGGRALGDDKAKYLNSPETPLFHKSDQMYGLYEARQAMRDLPRLLVVEGYMDVIALAQHGFPNAVATLGTATTASHLTTLFRQTQEVVFCFDGDAAGTRAARKAMDISLPVMRGARRVRFLFMPEGEDPDTLVRSDTGHARMQAAIDEARPASEVLLNGLVEGLDLATPDGRAQLIERARGPINALPPEAFRAELIGELSRLSRLPAADLRELFATNASARPAPEAGPASRSAGKRESDGARVTPVTRALALLLADTRLAAQATHERDNLADHDNPGARILAEAIDFFANNPNIAVARWLEGYRDNRYFSRLQTLAAQTPPGDDDTRAGEFVDAIARLTQHGRSRQTLRQRYNALIAQQERGPLDSRAAQELKEVLSQLQSSAG